MANRKEILMTMVKALASSDSIKSQKLAESAFHKQAAVRVHCMVEGIDSDEGMEFDFSVPTDDLGAEPGEMTADEDCCTCAQCGAEVDTPFCSQCGAENAEYSEEVGDDINFDDDSTDVAGDEFANPGELTSDDLNIK